MEPRFDRFDDSSTRLDETADRPRRAAVGTGPHLVRRRPDPNGYCAAMRAASTQL